MTRFKLLHRPFAASLMLVLLAGAKTGLAAEPSLTLDIPGGTLGSALQAFAAQSHQQVAVSSAAVAGHSVGPLRGRYTTEEALKVLLKGSGLDVDRSTPRLILLKPHYVVTSARNAQLDPPLVVVRDPVEPPNAVVKREPPLPSPPVDMLPASPLQEVLVTGTHIRGVTASASPLVDITRDDLRRSGDATIADALDRLPQNFGGQDTPNTALVGADRSGTNGAFAQGVNLRGLGSNATLVLIDGRRLAGSGEMGNFADLSAIPTAAVDHVEVLLDGASAIYGSDAVGGVVNIITRKDFQGAESLVRYGEDAGGHGPTLQVSQTVGLTWDGGHAVVAYEYQHQGDMKATARRYTADSDLTGLGGSNYDTVESSPGNILGLNAAHTAYVSTFAVPGGSGVGLTPGSFVAGATNFNNLRQDTDIEPRQDKNGVYVDVGQALDSKTEITFEGRYDLRRFVSDLTASEAILTVTKANPHYVSPNGAASELIGYSALGALGPIRDTGQSKSFDLSVGLNRSFLKTWKLQAYAGFAEEDGRRYAANEFNSSHLSEALGTTPDNPATPFSTAADGFFNPYGTGRSNAKAVLNFIGDGYTREVDSDQVSTINIAVDGDVIALPGGMVKAAFGAQYRHERGEFLDDAVTTATPFITGGVGYDRDVSAAFGELNIPIVGAANELPGLQRLTLSVAGRVEHYDDVGTTANPKIGLIWVPAQDVSIHASYGTSFRAPALYELHDNPVVSVANVPSTSGTTLSLIKFGGNTALKPETATSWTAGAEWRPHVLPGLRLTLDWFDIDYTNRIGDPGGSAIATVLTDPAYASLVTRVNGANPTDLAKIEAVLAKASSASVALYPPSAFGAIINAGEVNVASLDVSGFDLGATYRFDIGQNHISLSGSASYLYNYKQKTTPTSPWEQLVSTAGEPVDWRGRASVDWARGPYDAALTVNYVNSYWDPTSARSIDAWTTADLTLTWTAPPTLDWAKGVVISGIVQNLFDRDPPFYNAYYGVGYDAANANPLGRVVSLQVRKRW